MSSEYQTPNDIEIQFQLSKHTPETIREILDRKLDGELPPQWVMDQNDWTQDRRDNVVKLIMHIQRDMFLKGALYQRNKFRDALGLR